MSASANGADPQAAAEQMRLAAEYQRVAAKGLARADGSAADSTGAALSALERAEQITRSLLDPAAAPPSSSEPAANAVEYQQLIREYTRRLSYDQ